MKKLLLLSILLCITAGAYAQSRSCVLTGTPVNKRTSEVLTGALVTLTDEMDKDIKFQRKVTDDGFRIVVPEGSYDMEIKAEGYETYTLQIDMDETNTDLGFIRMLTDEMARAKAAKRKKK